jgi:hypothetical protein
VLWVWVVLVVVVVFSLASAAVRERVIRVRELGLQLIPLVEREELQRDHFQNHLFQSVKN